MKKNVNKKMTALLLAAAAALMISACGGRSETEPALEETAAEETVSAAAREAEPEVLSAEAETEGEETAEPDPIETDETYPSTIEAAAEDEENASYFGVMYATVIDIQTEEDGTTIYSLQDENDPENAWALSSMNIGDIIADMEKGGKVSFLFGGDIIHDSENVEFIAAVPYGTYQLGTATGTTENNVMSTFSIRTDDGQEMIFLKDNCKIEEGAMVENAGDRVRVYYAFSEAEQIYYPLRVFAAD